MRLAPAPPAAEGWQDVLLVVASHGPLESFVLGAEGGPARGRLQDAYRHEAGYDITTWARKAITIQDQVGKVLGRKKDVSKNKYLDIEAQHDASRILSVFTGR